MATGAGGLAIAAVGIALSHWLQMPALDGAASVLIGILLAGVAALLAWQSRGLLIGEGIHPETARALRDIALAQPGVRDVGRVLSMYVGPDDALVTMDLDFDAGTETADAAEPPGRRTGTEGHGSLVRLLVAGDSGAAGVGAPTQERALLSGPAPVSSPTMEFKDHYKTLGVERVFAAM